MNHDLKLENFSTFPASPWKTFVKGGGVLEPTGHALRFVKPKTTAKRYTNEVNRLYGVMDRQLKGKEYLCGAYSVADMAAWPWILPYKRQGQDMNDFPHLYRWFKRMGERPAVQRGLALRLDLRNRVQSRAEQERSRKILFEQKAR